MHHVIRLFVIVSLTAALAAGCAPQTEVVKLYDDPVRGAQAYARLLVVSLSSDIREQKNFENEIVAGLRGQGVDAVASYTHLDSSGGLLKDDINRVGEEIGADGILVSHIVSVDTRFEDVEGREEIQSTCRRGDPLDYFLYDRKVLREPNSVRMAHTVVVVTSLHDAGSQSRVWSIQSTCFEKATMADALLEEARAIVRQLRIDRLI